MYQSIYILVNTLIKINQLKLKIWRKKDMNKFFFKSLSNKSIIVSTIIVSLLILSATTAIPQAQGKVVNDQIDRYEEARSFATLLNDLKNDQSIPDQQRFSLPFWQTLLSLLLRLLRNKLTGIDGFEIPDLGGNGFFGRFSGILSILMNMLMMVLKLIIKGIVSVVGSILRILGSIVLIIMLILSGLQTGLASTAFFSVFLGIVSKIVIQALSFIGAPIYAIIAALLSISSGSLMGGLSFVLFSLLAIIIFFAIPIAIVVGILFIFGDELPTIEEIIEYIKGLFGDLLPDDLLDQFQSNGTGLIYMIRSIIKGLVNGNIA